MCSERKFHPAYKGARIIGMVILGLVTAVFFGFFFGYFVELLWNWLMPAIFGLTKITYWQAFGLVLLARLIFGSGGHHFGKHHHGPHHWHHKRHYHCDEDWEIEGGWQNWRYYDKWWKAEGKSAFEKFIAEGKHKEEEQV